MPIIFDKTPGSAKKHQRTRAGKPPEPQKPPGGPDATAPTMRVRIMRDFYCRLGRFRAGQVAEIERNTAASWVGFGLAEQDKMAGPAPETKG